MFITAGPSKYNRLQQADFHGGTAHAVSHLHSAWAPPTKKSPHSGTSHTVQGPHLAPTLALSSTGRVQIFHGGTSHTVSHLHSPLHSAWAPPTKKSPHSGTSHTVQGQHLAPTLAPTPTGRVEVFHGGTSHTVNHLHSVWAPPTKKSPHCGTSHTVQRPHLAPTLAPSPTGRVEVFHGGTSHAINHLHSVWAPPTHQTLHIGISHICRDHTLSLPSCLLVVLGVVAFLLPSCTGTMLVRTMEPLRCTRPSFAHPPCSRTRRCGFTVSSFSTHV
jgi:hypothetical protein